MQMFTKLLDWLKKNIAFILAGIFLFCMIACFVSGCNYHKHRHPCPEPTIVTNTVILHDTVTHIIDKWHYVQNTDTIIYTDTIIQPVDTAKILRDFFALHVYSRNWTDSLLTVDLRDTVTQNKFLQNDFRYRILRPQTIVNTTVDNSVNYSKYIYAGIDVPFYKAEYSEIAILIAFKGGYVGGGYAPLARGGSLKTGIRLFKWQ